MHLISKMFCFQKLRIISKIIYEKTNKQKQKQTKTNEKKKTLNKHR